MEKEEISQMKKELCMHLPEYTVLLNAYIDKAYQAGQEHKEKEIMEFLEQNTNIRLVGHEFSDQNKIRIKEVFDDLTSMCTH